MLDEPRAAERTETVCIGAGAYPLAPSEPLAPGTRVAVRYEILEVLGSGGFGVVYLAYDRLEDRRVALKLLRADRLESDALARFAREAALARRIESPHLVRIHDSDVGMDGAFLAMEVVEGESLASRLRRGPLSSPEALRVAGDVLAGLAALHAAGVVHRDVKPSNVLLGRDGRAKLADLGLARRQSSEETRATDPDVLMGTVEYLAPEQALGEEAGCRSDLYAVGVVMFEMLAGDVPHRARSSLGTLLAHVQCPAPDLHRLRPDVPDWLAAVVARLLAKAPEDRYPGAGDALRDLEQERASRPRQGSGSRGRRLRRGWVMAALCALLVALTAGGAALWLHRGDAELVQVIERPSSVAGIGRDGRTLWEIQGRVGPLRPARLKPGEPARLVGFLVPPGSQAAGPWHRLAVLDPATGRAVRSVELPDGSQEFPGFSNRYGAEVRVADLDGDGLDEVLVSYFHQPYWPSYLVLYEPLLERTRIVLFASGHHRFGAAVDVDGDGRKELVLRGINNRLGFAPVVAALRLEPPVNRPAGSRELVTSYTPDSTSADGLHERPALLWYALLPRTAAETAGEMTVDRARHTLILPSAAGRPPVVLGFDGFRVGLTSSLPPPERIRLRHQAYARLREARRLGEVGFGAESVAEAVAAGHLARESGDPALEEYVGRVQGQLLVRAGRPEQAEALFSRVAAASTQAPEVAFDAARAFHLAGRLDRAVRWYRRGLGPGGTESLGRAKYEFLEGLVFALADLGRSQEAYEAVRRYEAAERSERGSSGGEWRVLEEYARWHAGRLPQAIEIPGSASPDLFRYLPLEYRAARGAAPDTLLAGIRRELARSSDTTAMLRSLEAVELERLGRHREAVEAIRRAYERARSERSDQVYAQTFFPRIEARYRRIAGARRIRAAKAPPTDSPPILLASSGRY